MRQLTAKQKKFIDKLLTLNVDVRGWEDLTYKDMEELEEMNNIEILPQEVSRYIYDNRMSKI